MDSGLLTLDLRPCECECSRVVWCQVPGLNEPKRSLASLWTYFPTIWWWLLCDRLPPLLKALLHPSVPQQLLPHWPDLTSPSSASLDHFLHSAAIHSGNKKMRRRSRRRAFWKLLGQKELNSAKKCRRETEGYGELQGLVRNRCQWKSRGVVQKREVFTSSLLIPWLSLWVSHFLSSSFYCLFFF